MPITILDLGSVRNSFKVQRRTPRIKDHKQKLKRYDLDVIISGLQKYIRRGMIKEALFCGYILFRMKGVFRRKLIDRLLVITSEDIGISSLCISPFLCKVFGDEVFGQRKKEILISEKVIFTIICLLCTCSKDRSVDHAIYPMITRHVGIKDISEETTITDIESLKKEFYLSLVNRLEKRAVYFCGQLYYGKGRYESVSIPTENTGHAIFAAWDAMKRFYEEVVISKDEDQIILKNYESLLLIFRYFFAEKHGARPELLHMIHATILLVNFELILENVKRFGEIKILDQEEEVNVAKEKMEILDPVHDFVFDKHTKTGRNELDRGFKHFIEVGSVLENKIVWKDDIYFRKWKEFLLVDEKLKKRKVYKK